MNPGEGNVRPLLNIKSSLDNPQLHLQESTHTRGTTTISSSSMEHLPTGECPVTSVECCLTCLGDSCRHRFRREVELFLVAEKTYMLPGTRATEAERI